MKSYTKELMVEALKKLLKTKPLNKITVNDIVTECGASKQTFYNHFRDKYELFTFALTTVLSQNLADSADNSADFEETILNYLTRVLEERDFYRSFIRDEQAYKQISQCIADYSAEYYRRNAQQKLNCQKLPQELELAILFDAAGNAKLVVDWIYTGMKISPEKLAEVIYSCVPESIREFHGM